MDERFFSMEWTNSIRRLTYEEVVPAMHGLTKKRVFNGEERLTVPFVGADRSGIPSKIGVGILIPHDGEVLFTGFAIGRWLIQSWRAMRLLDEVNIVNQDIVRRSLFYMEDGRTVMPEELLSFAMGADSLDLIDRFGEIQCSLPQREELQAMIEALQNGNVSIDKARLERELTDAPYAQEILDSLKNSTTA